MKNCLLFLLLCCLLVRGTYGGAYMLVTAVKFENQHNRDSDGASCDLFGDLCDYMFYFCNHPNGRCVETVTAGVYYDRNAELSSFGNPMAGGAANPMRFNFPDGYTGEFTVFTLITDVDSSNDDNVDNVQISRTLAAGQPAVDYRQSGFRPSYPVYLTLRVSVHCDPNFYHSSCTVYCLGEDGPSGHFSCGTNGERVCLPGWTDPVTHCLTPVCAPACQHGSCSGPGICSCDPEYTGALCETAICKDGCQSGNCSVPDGCTCYPGYAGELCTIDERFCERQNPCQNGGACEDTGPNQYQCNCPYGYTGSTCDSAYDVCSVDGFCANGGTCSSEGTVVGQFECSCVAGYTGVRCEDLVDNCGAASCQNGATCVNALLSFTCQCAPGFTGDSCGDLVDYCSPDPCKNGAVCVSQLLDFVCVCSVTVDGSEPPKDCSGSPCLFHKCEGNGTCAVDPGNKAFCNCKPGLIGTFCEYVIPIDAGSSGGLDAGGFAGVAVGVVLAAILLCLLILCLVFICCKCVCHRKKRLDSPDRSEQYTYYDGDSVSCPAAATKKGGTLLGECTKGGTLLAAAAANRETSSDGNCGTLPFTNAGLDLLDESEDEAGYSSVGPPGSSAASPYDTLQHAGYTNSARKVPSPSSTAATGDRHGYSVPSPRTPSAAAGMTLSGRVSPPPNYTDLPSPLRRAFGGGGCGLPAPAQVGENPYDSPPVRFLRSEL